MGGGLWYLFLCGSSILTLPVCSVQSSHNEGQFKIRVFADFMNYYHLTHGIIVLSEDTQREFCANSLKSALHSLMQKRTIRFVNLANEVNLGDVFYRRSPRVGVLIPRLDEIAAQKILTEAAAQSYFDTSQVWLILSEPYSTTQELWKKLQKIFKLVAININADVTLGVMEKNNSSLKLYDLFKICHSCGLPLEIEFKGQWIDSEGLQIISKFKESFVKRRQNFKNISIKTVTVIREKPPNVTMLCHLSNDKNNKHLDVMPRKTYQLFKIMSELWNFNLEIANTDSWGTLFPNGSWGGLVGAVSNKEVDFTICPVRTDLKRVEVIDVSPQLHTEITRFLFRHPRRNPIRNIFFQPLTNEVWYCILVLIAVLVILMAVHVWQENKNFYSHGNTMHLPRIEPRFDNIALIIFEAIFMQGPSPTTFSFQSTRILVITSCVFSILLMQFYSAFIVGSLLADEPRSINTLAALYESNLEIGMENISFNYDFLRNTTNPLVQKIYKERIAKHPLQSIIPMDRGLERIGRGGFAFHVSLDRAYRILKGLLPESAYCDLQEISARTPIAAYAGIPKNSVYRNHLAYAVLTFRTSGIMQYNEKQWSVPVTDCSLIRNKDVNVDMEHFIPALVLLATAMLICLGVVLLECCFKRLHFL